MYLVKYNRVFNFDTYYSIYQYLLSNTTSLA